VAPEVDLAHLDLAADLREALEIDSMDFLNLAIAVREATGIEVPGRISATLVDRRLGHLPAERPDRAPRGQPGC
jgi:hypothetical protein